MNNGLAVKGRSLLLFIALVSLPLGAHAQEGTEWVPEKAAPQKAVPETAPVPAAPPPPATVQGTACLVANNGLDPASAKTGGQIVCDEIRNQGVALSANANVTSAYRVSFDRLGNDLIVRVSYEAPIGSVVRTRRLVLAGPEELPVAAPRMARAIVRDEALSESQRVDNLVKHETRKYEKKSGEFLWGFGILGVSGPGEGMWMSPGLEFMGYYETPEYGFGFSLRASFGSESGNSFSSSSASVGGRYFFSDGEVSPFAGAGFAISGVQVSEENTDFDGSGSGLGAFGEVGLEFMRLHGSRFILGLRLDAPFYRVKADSYSWESSGAGEPPASRYELPLTLSAAYAW